MKECDRNIRHGSADVDGSAETVKELPLMKRADVDTFTDRNLQVSLSKNWIILY
jgi:hypothetical protein